MILALGASLSKAILTELWICRERIITSIFYEPFCLEKDFVQKFHLDLYALIHKEMFAGPLLHHLCVEGRKASIICK